MNPHKVLTISGKRLLDKCPRAWTYRNKLELAPKQLPDAIVRGTELHEAAEGKQETAKQVAYNNWQEQFDDFTYVEREKAFIVSLTALHAYSGDEYGPHAKSTKDWTYGGVIDAVGYLPENQALAILDHKSVLNFYPVPELFSKEQIGMYAVAWEILTGEAVKHGVISRVKQVEAGPDHAMNYIIKELEKAEIGLNKTRIREILTNARKYDIIEVEGGESGNTINSNKTNSNTTNTNNTKLVKIKLTPKGIKVGVTVYNFGGRMIESIQLIRGNLIHVKRYYYLLTPEEKRNVVVDFIASAYYIRGANHPGRRSPGLHCNQCPYLKPCEAARLTNTPEDVNTILADYPDLELQTPNKELLDRLGYQNDQEIDPRATSALPEAL